MISDDELKALMGRIRVQLPAGSSAFLLLNVDGAFRYAAFAPESPAVVAQQLRAAAEALETFKARH